MFSFLNLYHTNFEKSNKNLNFILGKDENYFFIKRKKNIIYQFPCIDFKTDSVMLGCINVRFFKFNLPYFFYSLYMNIDKEKKTDSEYIRKNIVDYTSYKNNIVRYLYEILDNNKMYYHDYIYDETFYHIFNQYHYYSSFLYLYFIKNFMILGGKDTNSSDNEYEIVMNLYYESIVREIYRCFLKAVDQIQDIKSDEKYRYRDVLEKIDIKNFSKLASVICNFLNRYLEEHFNIEVEYHKEVADDYNNVDYNDDDDDDDYDDYYNNDNDDGGDYIMTYDCNIKYFVFLNLLNRDFVINININYDFFNYINQEHYHIFGDPFQMIITIIKNIDKLKIKIDVQIDKNITDFSKVTINFNRDKFKIGDNHLQEKEEDRFYKISILSIIDVKNADLDSLMNLLNVIREETEHKKVNII